MNRENLYKSVIIIAFLLIILFGFLINLFLGESALILFFFISFLFALFFLIQLYLRVQHNIDNVRNFDSRVLNQKITNELKNVNNEFQNVNNELKNVRNEFNKIKESSEELVDFLEILVDFLESLKKKTAEEKLLLDSIKDIFNENDALIKDKFNENREMQKKIASGVEDLFNSQYEQTAKLQKDWENKFNDFLKKSKNNRKR